MVWDETDLNRQRIKRMLNVSCGDGVLFLI
jgi:hypothetical protein